MKLAKFLTIFVFAFLLISSASAAMLVYATWEDGSQSATIVEGETIDFSGDFGSIRKPLTTNIRLYTFAGQIVETFEEGKVTNNDVYYPSYTIDSSIYGPGIYELYFTATDSEGDFDSHVLYLTIESETIIDTNAPVITQNGELEITINLGDTYVDAGAHAHDIKDGDISEDIIDSENVNTDAIGTYFWTYNVQDSDGNWAEPVTRTIHVVDPSVVNIPTIQLLGNPVITLDLGDTYVEPGFLAADAEDGDLTDQVDVGGDTVNTSNVDVYVVTYNVQDSDGNWAEEKIRTIMIIDSGITDTTAPTITVIVPQASIYNNDEFTFEVNISEESNVVFDLNDEGNVSMTEINANNFRSMILNLLEGNHSVTFYATDLAGNVGEETVDFSIDLSDDFEFEFNVLVPKQGVEYDEEITFRVETNAVADVEFSLNGEINVSMDYQGTNNGISTFVYSDIIPEGDHEITFYIEDSAGNLYSETVAFSTDDGSSKKKEKEDNEDDFYDKKYKEQQTFVNSPIHLNEDLEEEELTLCQKFLAWFKNTFGFEFFYFLVGLFLLLIILILIYILKKYREHYL